MYCPKYANLPMDVYRKTLAVANSYPEMRQRAPYMDESTLTYKVTLWQLEAIESALEGFKSEAERTAIKKNMFEGTEMKCINVPMSISGMKRARGRFMQQLAKNLGFIE